MAATPAQDGLITVKDVVNVRQRSLELAVEAAEGVKFGQIIELAKLFEEYVLEGKTPDSK